MTAWVKKGTREEVGIITDYVSPESVPWLDDLPNRRYANPYIISRSL